jgi:hypothetical protein
MRTTLIVEDALYKRAKERAVSLNTTVSDVVNQALREAMAKPLRPRVPFEMVTFGDPTQPRRTEPSDFAAALYDDDAASLAR